jgi:hypothetical protein
MHFSPAAVVVGSGLLPTVSSFIGKVRERYGELTTLKDLADLQDEDSSFVLTGDTELKLHRMLKNDHPFHKNQYQQQGYRRQHNFHTWTRECDPASFDPDVGILSCGVMEYCNPSDDSALGGRCVARIPLDHDDLIVRRIQEEGNATYNATEEQSQFEYYFEYFCSSGTCTCTNINATEYTFSASCKPWYRGCYEVTTLCGSKVYGCSSIDLDLTWVGKGTYELFVCLTNTEPKYETICYNMMAANDTKQNCSVTVDGENCASCEVIPRIREMCDQNGTCYNETRGHCYHFDCTNLPEGVAGTDCSVYANFMLNYGCDVQDEEQEVSAEKPSGSLSQTTLGAGIMTAVLSAGILFQEH